MNSSFAARGCPFHLPLRSRTPLLCRRLNPLRPYTLQAVPYERPGPRSLFPRLSKLQGTSRKYVPASASAFASKAKVPQKPRRLRRFARTTTRLALGTTLLTALAVLVDYSVNDAALGRSLRTFALGLLVAADYKLNFRENPPVGGTIEDLHARSARRLFDLLRANGGLYLKIGQAIAMQSAILPPEFQRMFSRMFDDAPQNEWADVERVIREDFGGRSVEDVFGVSFSEQEGRGVMERTARASASVAQVHWARLADGREVAVKVQKKEIANQVRWDLWTFRAISRVYSYFFDIPFDKLVPYITERLMLETDFEEEARNGERMADLIAGEPRLRGRVYVPRVDHALSSKRVLTAEWIEGVRLWDKEAITRPWLEEPGQGSPGCRGTPLDPPGASPLRPHAKEESADLKDHLKPVRDRWRGTNSEGGLGLSLNEVMTTMVDLFSAQMFLWGWVHADPHPGNIFIQRQPSGHSELVLIDHGLYIQMSPKFRHQYARFWTALLELDNVAIADVVKEWGIKSDGGELFASATLMRPYTGGKGRIQKGMSQLSQTEKRKRSYEMQQQSRKMIREILGDEDKWPRELIFIGRNLRIVQGNNQFLGSPVNRVKITATWASRARFENRDLTFLERTKNLGRHFIFNFVMFTSDVIFWWSSFKKWIGRGKGMEDDVEEQMKVIAKDMGIDLNHKVFDG